MDRSHVSPPGWLRGVYQESQGLRTSGIVSGGGTLPPRGGTRPGGGVRATGDGRSGRGREARLRGRKMFPCTSGYRGCARGAGGSLWRRSSSSGGRSACAHEKAPPLKRRATESSKSFLVPRDERK